MLIVRFALSAALGIAGAASAQAVDPSIPSTIPKYRSSLVIPPEMPPSSQQPCAPGAGCPEMKYNVSARQFKQQILPPGAPPTTVWGYGRAQDALNLDANGVQTPNASSSFFSPGFTFENVAGQPTQVRWINELVTIDPTTGRPYKSGDAKRKFVPPLIAVDPTLHWANPGKVPCDRTGVAATDCKPNPSLLEKDADGNAAAYSGPVPMVVHVHGADDNPQSDGYPESWFLPDATNIDPAFGKFGRQFDQYFRSNSHPGSTASLYENTQPATTLWYHDHSMGITHNTVYAGEAGFWLIRGNYVDAATGKTISTDPVPGMLPGSRSALGRPTHPSQSYAGGVQGCDPNNDPVCRANIREIPIVITDRTFASDGSLYYAKSRSEADAYAAGVKPVPYAPQSDVSPILNPEYFGNAMVVNGRTWPTLQVMRDRYRFRILSAGDARTLNLSLWTIPADLIAQYGSAEKVPNSAIVAPGKGVGGKEIPFYQIGSDQGLMPKVVQVRSGHRSWVMPGGGREPVEVPCVTERDNKKGKVVRTPTYAEDPFCERALLLAPAERADVVVSFDGLAAGTVVRMINTGPDAPFGGFPLNPMDAAAEGTTDQIMQFEVQGGRPGDNGGLPPSLIALSSEAPLSTTDATLRKVSLVENESERVCVDVDLNGDITGLAYVKGSGDMSPCEAPSVSFGPDMTMLGTVDSTNRPVGQAWADPITQVINQGGTELWEMYNFTQDAHPVHIHATRFLVLSRQSLMPDADNPALAAQPAVLAGPARRAEPTESGYKDVVTANPLEITRVLARFDRPGVYVWHCHILEHEDNEMMVPMCIRKEGSTGPCVNADSPGGLPAPANITPVPVALGL